MSNTREDVRNIAIIAHVDHGKTTMVDALIKQSGVYRENQKVEERVMDSNDLEKERGITILSKNMSVNYNDVKINIVDTPGHADFGGEVERVLKMVDGVLLLVDAFEGAMPQTRFVLKKALELDLKPIVVINKIDRPEARPNEVIDEVLDLFIELGADDDQLEFDIVYASAKQGISTLDLDVPGVDMKPLFETIVNKIPMPTGDVDGALQFLGTTLDADEYVGKIAIGKIVRGSVKLNQQVAISNKDGESSTAKVTRLYEFRGLKRVEIEEAKAGDIVAIAGLANLSIGDTVCQTDCIEPLDFVDIDEPTLSMAFSVNNGPLAGKEGDFVTTRHIKDRLTKELETNVSLRVADTDSTDTFEVSGRGELHLSVLIETMRREGFELLVSRPKVIFKEIDGQKCEPIEYLVIDVPEEYVGTIMDKIGSRKGELANMHPNDNGYTHLEFKIPARGLIGFRSEFMTDTKGNGIMNHVFDSYGEYKGEIPVRSKGSLVAFESGTAVTYGLFNAQERGTLFIDAGTEVYEGMVIGENSRPGDIVVNICKKKHLTNTRSSGADDALKLIPPNKLSLEEAIEFISDDELVEVTPENIRVRKSILTTDLRLKADSRKK